MDLCLYHRGKVEREEKENKIKVRGKEKVGWLAGYGPSNLPLRSLPCGDMFIRGC